MLTVVDRVRGDAASAGMATAAAGVGYRLVAVRSGSEVRPGSCGCARPLVRGVDGGWRHLSDGTLCAAQAGTMPMMVVG